MNSDTQPISFANACQQHKPDSAYHHEYHNGQVERTTDTILDRRWFWWLLIPRLAHVFRVLIVGFPFHLSISPIVGRYHRTGT